MLAVLSLWGAHERCGASPELSGAFLATEEHRNESSRPSRELCQGSSYGEAWTSLGSRGTVDPDRQQFAACVLRSSGSQRPSDVTGAAPSSISLSLRRRPRTTRSQGAEITMRATNPRGSVWIIPTGSEAAQLEPPGRPRGRAQQGWLGGLALGLCSYRGTRRRLSDESSPRCPGSQLAATNGQSVAVAAPEPFEELVASARS